MCVNPNYWSWCLDLWFILFTTVFWQSLTHLICSVLRWKLKASTRVSSVNGGMLFLRWRSKWAEFERAWTPASVLLDNSRETGPSGFSRWSASCTRKDFDWQKCSNFYEHFGFCSKEHHKSDDKGHSGLSPAKICVFIPVKGLWAEHEKCAFLCQRKSLSESGSTWNFYSTVLTDKLHIFIFLLCYR